jgi:hypothetical protein
VHPASPFAFSREALAVAGLLLRQLLAGLALTVTAYVAGRTLLGWLGVAALENRGARDAAEPAAAAGPRLGPGPAPDQGARPWLDPGGALETAALAISLGLVVVAHAGLLLGLAGLLKPWPILVGLLGIHLASLPAWRSLLSGRRGLPGLRGLRGPSGRAGRLAGQAEDGGEAAPRWRPRLLWLAAGAVALLPPAILTLYPPTAFDATLYHLPYARAFAASGALPFLPDLRIPIFPQLLETLFAVPLPFAGELATQAVALIATLLTVALILVWGRRFSPAAGWIAAAAYAGSPLVVYLAATAYVEPGLVAFATAALYAASRWRDGGGPGWLTLAAVFAGAAADTKYLGLFVLGLVAMAAVAAPPAGRQASRWRSLARVALAGAILVVPWYGRIVAATGNPVFPFLPEVFGFSAWNPASLHPAVNLRTLPGELALRLLRLPWDAVFDRSRLGSYPPWSPVFLLALPALLAGAAVHQRVRALLLAAAAYAAVILAFHPDARYLLLTLPLVCVAVGDSLAWSLAWLATRPPLASRASPASFSGWARRRLPDERRVTAAAALLAVAVFLPGWSYSLYSLHRLGPVPASPAEREAFLARKLPVFASIRYLDRVCGSSYTLYAIHAENMVYFAAGRFLGDWTGLAAYPRVVPANGDAELLYRRLRSLGADHLLIVEGDPALPPMFTAAFDSRFRLIYADGRARVFALRGTGCGPGS